VKPRGLETDFANYLKAKYPSCCCQWHATTAKTHTHFRVQFLQRVSIACYAERCISHSKSVRPSVCLSVRLSHAGTESKRLKLRSWGLHWRI